MNIILNYIDGGPLFNFSYRLGWKLWIRAVRRRGISSDVYLRCFLTVLVIVELALNLPRNLASPYSVAVFWARSHLAVMCCMVKILEFSFN